MKPSIQISAIWRFPLEILLGVWLLFDQAWGEDVRGIEIFEKSIRPTLLDHCVECHGEKKQKGGLRLDSRGGWQTGGDSGPVIVPGKPQESLLLQAIRYSKKDFEMPPEGKLPASVVSQFEEWILRGAPDPRTNTPNPSSNNSGRSLDEQRSYWSFQPIQKGIPPSVESSDWPATDTDFFILSSLESSGLSPAPQASPESQVRRLYYDLLGLPPTPEALESFAQNPSPDAWKSLVDSLLDSPRFGERWGRHWLDVVRFAESSGGGRTLLFPDAWRYRDFVIQSFNNDLPFSRFVQEQIAGDLLPASHWEDRRRQTIATGLLVLGPTNYELQDKDMLEMDIVDEQLDTLGKAFMGMTVGCARCHDHKFDPISTADYYAMAGIFKSTLSVIHDNVSKWNEVDLPLSPEEETAYTEHQARITEATHQLTRLREEYVALGGRLDSSDKNKKPTSKGIALSDLPGIVVDDEAAQLEGTWKRSSASTPFVGAGYQHDSNEDKGAKRAIFTPTLPHAGRYEIQVACVPSSNRASSVKLTVFHQEGESEVLVNQKVPGPIEGYRVSLGTFFLDPNSNPKVVLSNEGAEDGHVIADAVLFLPESPVKTAEAVPPLPREDQVDRPEMIPFIIADSSSLEGIVVDNHHAELQGEWLSSVHTPPFVGGDYIHDKKEEKGLKSATFRPNLPSSGLYEVRMSHNTNIRRANHVPIRIHHARGETVIHVNEGEEAPMNKLFHPLGTFYFDKGTGGAVTILTTGTEGKYVIVDSVQWIRQKSLEEIEAEKLEKIRATRREELLPEIQRLEASLKELEKSAPKHPVCMAVTDHSKMGDIPIAIRGVVHNVGPIVPRGVPMFNSALRGIQIDPSLSGRKEFADWLVDPNHPLTSRVFVNRVWHWLFGQGLVRSVDNFGSMGERPSHPELLDYLAASFMENGWSTKHLIRELVLSSTYRQSTTSASQGSAVDPDNRLLWRMNRKRMDAESFRDYLLFLSGNLDLTYGGPNIKPGTSIEYGYEFDSPRRSTYLPVFRNTLPEIFVTFDFADPNLQMGKRTQSTIASQALLLMNHPFVLDQARHTAVRLLDGSKESRDWNRLVRRAFSEILGRNPTQEEIQLCQDFFQDQPFDENRWSMLIQTLFQSIDFRFLN